MPVFTNTSLKNRLKVLFTALIDVINELKPALLLHHAFVTSCVKLIMDNESRDTRKEKTEKTRKLH
jgi:hypothetical protein